MFLMIKINKMKQSNKENIKHRFKTPCIKQSSKSAQQLPVKVKKKQFNDQNCRSTILRQSLSNAKKYLPSLEHKADEDSLVGSKKNSESFNAFSTIQMLKKQAELLDLQDQYGTIHKLSTLEHLKTSEPFRNVMFQITKFKKPNTRKIAKGRPQIYNWVRMNKMEMAELNCEYQTQIMKKSKSPSTQIRGTFLERLKKLDELNDKTQSFQLRRLNRIHSECSEDPPNAREHIKTEA